MGIGMGLGGWRVKGPGVAGRQREELDSEVRTAGGTEMGDEERMWGEENGVQARWEDGMGLQERGRERERERGKRERERQRVGVAG